MAVVCERARVFVCCRCYMSVHVSARMRGNIREEKGKVRYIGESKQKNSSYPRYMRNSSIDNKIPPHKMSTKKKPQTKDKMR